MAVHTTVAKVEAVMRAFDKKKDLSTSTFILPANNLVRRYCEPLGYDEETLELIERYLAAHFYCVTARRPVEQYVGQARNRYEDNVGLGLDATWYGQQAKLFDSLGGLTAAMSEKVNVGFFWLGDGTPYDRDYTK